MGSGLRSESPALVLRQDEQILQPVDLPAPAAQVEQAHGYVLPPAPTPPPRRTTCGGGELPSTSATASGCWTMKGLQLRLGKVGGHLVFIEGGKLLFVQQVQFHSFLHL